MLGVKERWRRCVLHAVFQLLCGALDDAFTHTEAFAVTSSRLFLQREALDALVEGGRLVEPADVNAGHVDLIGVKASWADGVMVAEVAVNGAVMVLVCQWCTG